MLPRRLIKDVRDELKRDTLTLVLSWRKPSRLLKLKRACGSDLGLIAKGQNQEYGFRCGSEPLRQSS
jgi:hypothetical protein